MTVGRQRHEDPPRHPSMRALHANLAHDHEAFPDDLAQSCPAPRRGCRPTRAASAIAVTKNFAARSGMRSPKARSGFGSGHAVVLLVMEQPELAATGSGSSSATIPRPW